MLIFDIAFVLHFVFCSVVHKSVYLCLCKNPLTRVSHFPRATSTSSADRGVPVSRVIGVSLYFPVVRCRKCGVCSFCLPAVQSLSIFHSLGSVSLSLVLTFIIVKYPDTQPSCVSLELAFLPCQGHTVSPTLTFPKLTL